LDAFGIRAVFGFAFTTVLVAGVFLTEDDGFFVCAVFRVEDEVFFVCFFAVVFYFAILITSLLSRGACCASISDDVNRTPPQRGGDFSFC